MSADMEQLFHELEQRYASLRKESDIIAADRDSWKEKSSGYVHVIDELKASLESFQSKISIYEIDTLKKEETIKSLEKSVETVNGKYIRKSEEVDRLRNEMKMNTDELLLMQTRMKDAQSQATESQNQLLPLQYEFSRCQQDKQFLEERLKSTESELQSKLHALANEKSLTSNLKFELDTKVTELKAELELTKNRLKSSQDQITLLTEKNSTLQLKVRELEEQNASRYELFLKESDGLRKVNELQKRHLDDANEIVAELETNITTLKDTHSRQINQIRLEAQNRIEIMESNFNRIQEELEAKIKDLEEENKNNMKNKNKNNNDNINLNSQVATIEEDSSKQLTVWKDTYGTNIYELYDRIVTLEKQKIHEQDKRQETEIYLQHVLKDIEQKTPMLAEQKRNYHRLVESHNYLTQKYDELVNQNSLLLVEMKKLETEKKHAVTACDAFEQHNKDLSKQVQHLLKRSMELQHGKSPQKIKMGGDQNVTSGDVISDYLVNFDDIEELQLRNTQLLQTIRKLEKDIEESNALAEERASEATSAALSAAMKEITALREQRQHTEELVHSLVQQRDMYKAMTQESGILTITHGSSNSSNHSIIPVGDIHMTPKTPGERTSMGFSPSKTIQELQMKLATSEDEKMKLKDRLTRLEEAEKLLNEALTSLKAETSKLRMDAVMNASEARFNKDRAIQLEEALKIATNENATGLQRRLDMEKILIEQQHVVRTKEEQYRQILDQLHMTMEQQRRAEVEAQSAQAAENRLKEQLSNLREEMKRQASLSESVHRIELGLSSRVEEEKALLITERDTAVHAAEQLRKQLSEITIAEEQRILSIQQNLTTTRQSLEEKISECNSLKQDLIREQVTAKTMTERNHLLEKQLSLTQERLYTAQGVKVVESIAEQQLTELQLELDQLKAQIISLKHQLQAAEAHGEEYRKLSASTDHTLKELQQVMTNTKATYDADISKYQEMIATLQQDIVKTNASTSTLLQEVEDAREQVRIAAKTQLEQQQSYESQITSLNQALSQAQQQVEQLKVDVVKFQGVAKTAHTNYERELLLHATAQKELGDTRDQLEQQSQIAKIAEEKYAALAAEMIRKGKLFADQITSLENTLTEKEKRIEELQNVNDLLHNQVHNLSLQVDKMLVNRGQPVNSSNDDGSNNGMSGSTSVSTSANAEENVTERVVSATASTSASTSALVSVETETLSEMQQTITELREVVRYMKRERDLLSAKLSLAEAESSRHVATLNTLHRHLDELRAQLTHLKEQSNVEQSSHTSEEMERLKQELQQLPLLRESNAHLRQANAELMQRLETVDKEVKNLRSQTQPLEEKVQRLLAEKAALESVSQQDATDAKYWRERLQQLVARYHEVDPEEHRLLKESVVSANNAAEAAKIATKTATDALEASKAVEKALNASLASKAAEFQQLQNTYETLEKNSGILRTKLRELKTKYDETNAKLVAKTKIEAELTKQVIVLNEQITVLNSKVVLATPLVSNVSTTVSKPVNAVSTTTPSSSISTSAVISSTASAMEITSSQPTSEVLDVEESTSASTGIHLESIQTTTQPVSVPTPSRKRPLESALAPTVAAISTTTTPAIAIAQSEEPAVVPLSSTSTTVADLITSPFTEQSKTDGIVSTPSMSTTDTSSSSMNISASSSTTPTTTVSTEITTTSTGITADDKLSKMKQQLLLRKRTLGGTSKSTTATTTAVTSSSAAAAATSESTLLTTAVEESKSSAVNMEMTGNEEIPAHKKTKVEDVEIDVELEEQSSSSQSEAMDIAPSDIPSTESDTKVISEVTMESSKPFLSKDTNVIPTGTDNTAIKATIAPVTAVTTTTPVTSNPVLSTIGSIFGSASSNATPSKGGIFGTGFGSGSPSIVSSGNSSIFGSSLGSTGQSAFGTGSMLPFGGLTKGIFGTSNASVPKPVEETSHSSLVTSSSYAMEEGLIEEGEESVVINMSAEEENKELATESTAAASTATSTTALSSSSFLNLRPPSPSIGPGSSSSAAAAALATTSIPMFGFGKGSLPVPALLTPTLPTPSPFKPTGGTTSSLFRRPTASTPTPTSTPPISTITNPITTTSATEPDVSEALLNTLPFSSTMTADPSFKSPLVPEPVVATSTSTENVSTPASSTTSAIPIPIPMKVAKTTPGAITMAQKKEMRAQRFAEAAAAQQQQQATAVSQSNPETVSATEDPSSSSVTTTTTAPTTTTAAPRPKTIGKPKAKLATLVKSQQAKKSVLSPTSGTTATVTSTSSISASTSATSQEETSAGSSSSTANDSNVNNPPAKSETEE